MMWAETRRIGCGAIQYEGKNVNIKYETFLVCNYGPAGNTVGKAVYKRGTTAASDCLPGTKANTETGLCEGEASTDTEISQMNTGSGVTTSMSFANECPSGQLLNIETGLCEEIPPSIITAQNQCPLGTQINLCEGTRRKLLLINARLEHVQITTVYNRYLASAATVLAYATVLINQ